VVNVVLTPQGRELETAASRAQHDVVDQTGLCGDDLTDLRNALQALVLTMSTEPS
jgi:hypothetical protein